MFAAFGVVAALFNRERTGAGRQIDVSMLDSMMAMQPHRTQPDSLYFDDTPKPAGNRHPVTYPVDSFPTRNRRHRDGLFFAGCVPGVMWSDGPTGTG